MIGATFLIPSEWLFEAGEAVVVHGKNIDRGTIVSTAHPNFLEIRLDLDERVPNDDGIHRVSRSQVRKLVKPGQSVTVVSGSNQGSRGFVVKVEGDFVELVGNILGDISHVDPRTGLNVCLIHYFLRPLMSIYRLSKFTLT